MESRDGDGSPQQGEGPDDEATLEYGFSPDDLDFGTDQPHPLPHPLPHPQQQQPAESLPQSSVELSPQPGPSGLSLIPPPPPSSSSSLHPPHPPLHTLPHNVFQLTPSQDAFAAGASLAGFSPDNESQSAPPGPPILSPLLETFPRLQAEERERERQETERRRRFDEHQTTQMAALLEAGEETHARRASAASRQASGANEQGPPGVDPEVVARQQRILDKILNQRRMQRVPASDSSSDELATSRRKRQQEQAEHSGVPSLATHSRTCYQDDQTAFQTESSPSDSDVAGGAVPNISTRREMMMRDHEAALRRRERAMDAALASPSPSSPPPPPPLPPAPSLPHSPTSSQGGETTQGTASDSASGEPSAPSGGAMTGSSQSSEGGGEGVTVSAGSEHSSSSSESAGSQGRRTVPARPALCGQSMDGAQPGRGGEEEEGEQSVAGGGSVSAGTPPDGGASQSEGGGSGSSSAPTQSSSSSSEGSHDLSGRPSLLSLAPGPPVSDTDGTTEYPATETASSGTASECDTTTEKLATSQSLGSQSATTFDPSSQSAATFDPSSQPLHQTLPISSTPLEEEGAMPPPRLPAFGSQGSLLLPPPPPTRKRSSEETTTSTSTATSSEMVKIKGNCPLSQSLGSQEHSLLAPQSPTPPSNAPVSRLLPGEATTVIPSSPGFDEEDGVMESSQPLQESVDLQHLLANEIPAWRRADIAAEEEVVRRQSQQSHSPSPSSSSSSSSSSGSSQQPRPPPPKRRRLTRSRSTSSAVPDVPTEGSAVSSRSTTPASLTHHRAAPPTTSRGREPESGISHGSSGSSSSSGNASSTHSGSNHTSSSSSSSSSSSGASKTPPGSGSGDAHNISSSTVASSSQGSAANTSRSSADGSQPSGGQSHGSDGHSQGSGGQSQTSGGHSQGSGGHSQGSGGRHSKSEGGSQKSEKNSKVACVGGKQSSSLDRIPEEEDAAASKSVNSTFTTSTLDSQEQSQPTQDSFLRKLKPMDPSSGNEAGLSSFDSSSASLGLNKSSISEPPPSVALPISVLGPGSESIEELDQFVSEVPESMSQEDTRTPDEKDIKRDGVKEKGENCLVVESSMNLHLSASSASKQSDSCRNETSSNETNNPSQTTPLEKSSSETNDKTSVELSIQVPMECENNNDLTNSPPPATKLEVASQDSPEDSQQSFSLCYSPSQSCCTQETSTQSAKTTVASDAVSAAVFSAAEKSVEECLEEHEEEFPNLIEQDNGMYVTDIKEFESSMQMSCSPVNNGQVIQNPCLLPSQATDSNSRDKPLTATRRPVPLYESILCESQSTECASSDQAGSDCGSGTVGDLQCAPEIINASNNSSKPPTQLSNANQAISLQPQDSPSDSQNSDPLHFSLPVFTIPSDSQFEMSESSPLRVPRTDQPSRPILPVSSQLGAPLTGQRSRRQAGAGCSVFAFEDEESTQTEAVDSRSHDRGCRLETGSPDHSRLNPVSCDDHTPTVPVLQAAADSIASYSANTHPESSLAVVASTQPQPHVQSTSHPQFSHSQSQCLIQSTTSLSQPPHTHHPLPSPLPSSLPPLEFTSPLGEISPAQLQALRDQMAGNVSSYELRHIRTYRTVIEQRVVTSERVCDGSVVEGSVRVWPEAVEPQYYQEDKVLISDCSPPPASTPPQPLPPPPPSSPFVPTPRPAQTRNSSPNFRPLTSIAPVRLAAQPGDLQTVSAALQTTQQITSSTLPQPTQAALTNTSSSSAPAVITLTPHPSSSRASMQTSRLNSVEPVSLAACQSHPQTRAESVSLASSMLASPLLLESTSADAVATERPAQFDREESPLPPKKRKSLKLKKSASKKSGSMRRTVVSTPQKRGSGSSLKKTLPGSALRRVACSPLKSVSGSSESGSPLKSVSGSPLKSVSGSPLKSVSGSPLKSVSGSPPKSVSGSPPKSVSGSPPKSVSGSPPKSVSGSPPKSVSGSPPKSVSGSPPKSVTPSPAVVTVSESVAGPSGEGGDGGEGGEGVGSVVMAQYRDKYWYLGTVNSVAKNGRFIVYYADGERGQVSRASIFPVEQVKVGVAATATSLFEKDDCEITGVFAGFIGSSSESFLIEQKNGPLVQCAIERLCLPPASGLASLATASSLASLATASGQNSVTPASRHPSLKLTVGSKRPRPPSSTEESSSKRWRKASTLSSPQDERGGARVAGEGETPADQRRLFEGYSFLLTQRPPKDDQGAMSPATGPVNKEAVASLITSRRGRVLEAVGDERIISDRFFVLSDQHCRTKKFLIGLALDVPCVKYRWIEKCIQEGRVVEYSGFRLPVGVPAGCSEPLPWKPRGRSTIMKHVKVHVHGSASFKNHWVPILAKAGATLYPKVPSATSIVRSNSAALCDLVIICETTVRHSLPNNILHVSALLGMKLLKAEWIIQSLICGRVLENNSDFVVT